ncbi:MAG: hypothetical protein FWH59_04435 [Lentimicrobiaceae bacterium]|nr:hypothetical protein [Lentimicrobiaceae bacterium]
MDKSQILQKKRIGGQSASTKHITKRNSIINPRSPEVVTLLFGGDSIAAKLSIQVLPV